MQVRKSICFEWILDSIFAFLKAIVDSVNEYGEMGGGEIVHYLTKWTRTSFNEDVMVNGQTI